MAPHTPSSAPPVPHKRAAKNALAKNSPTKTDAPEKRDAPRKTDAPGGAARPRLNVAESPLAWLARRVGKDGRALVDATQLMAGERLRADFTRAQLTPRVTSRWSPVSGAGGPEAFSDMVLAAKTRVSRAMTAVGPELSGVLLDVCCFLKGLEAVEREHSWPARTAKVVLSLALDRLAAHYGLSRMVHGPARTPTRSWQAPPEPAGEDGVPGP